MPTDDEITVALQVHADQWGPDAWVFGAGWVQHTEAKARMIVKACLLLGQPVSDVLTIDIFLALTERLVALEGRLDALGNA